MSLVKVTTPWPDRGNSGGGLLAQSNDRRPLGPWHRPAPCPGYHARNTAPRTLTLCCSKWPRGKDNAKFKKTEILNSRTFMIYHLKTVSRRIARETGQLGNSAGIDEAAKMMPVSSESCIRILYIYLRARTSSSLSKFPFF